MVGNLSYLSQVLATNGSGLTRPSGSSDWFEALPCYSRIEAANFCDFGFDRQFALGHRDWRVLDFRFVLVIRLIN